MNREYKGMQRRLWEEGYEICGKIGEGGTSRVYRVKNRKKGEEFACKVSELIERIRPEERLLRQLRHPLFPAWEAYYEEKGTGILIMELIAGSSLEEHLRRRHVFTQKETVRIVIELADGLACLHEKTPSVIYRDIKPSNIMIRQDGRISLLDLGAAAMPENCRVGTAGSAAPDQGIGAVTGCLSGAVINEHESLRPVCDVYALGILMHSMLTGYDPLSESAGKREEFCYRADVRFGVEEIIERCLRINCDERIPGMRELVRELSAYHNRTPLQMTLHDLRKKHYRNTVRYTQNIWLSEYKT